VTVTVSREPEPPALTESAEGRRVTVLLGYRDRDGHVTAVRVTVSDSSHGDGSSCRTRSESRVRAGQLEPDGPGRGDPRMSHCQPLSVTVTVTVRPAGPGGPPAGGPGSLTRIWSKDSFIYHDHDHDRRGRGH
jgi:hypothetical protein